MKKILSVVLSLVMAVTVMAMATTAIAAESPQATTHNRVNIGEVNGSSSTDVTFKVDQDDPSKIEFTYNGPGVLEGWEFPTMTQGVDFDIVKEEGNSITIVVYNPNAEVVANAIVSGLDEDGEDKPGKPDNGSTSPNTGAMTAAGIAVAGAGVAILAALKKDEDAE